MPQSPTQPKPRHPDPYNSGCRVRVTANQDLTYEEYTRILFDREWDRQQAPRDLKS